MAYPKASRRGTLTAVGRFDVRGAMGIGVWCCEASWGECERLSEDTEIADEFDNGVGDGRPDGDGSNPPADCSSGPSGIDYAVDDAVGE